MTGRALPECREPLVAFDRPIPVVSHNLIMRVGAATIVMLVMLAGCSNSGGQGGFSPVGAGKPRVTVAPDSAAGKSTSPPAPTTTPAPTPQQAGRPPVRAELIGTWKPNTLLGRDVRSIRRINGGRPIVTFGQYSFGLGWTAYDGCNWTSGRIRLWPSGRYSLSAQATTTRGCIGSGDNSIANVKVVIGADQIRLNRGRLSFYDAAGGLLGTYLRTHAGL